MLNERIKEVEFRLIDDDEMPPLIIKSTDDGTTPVIVINQAHNIWLSLQRYSIPGIAKSLAEKLNSICDAYLEQQLNYKGLE